MEFPKEFFYDWGEHTTCPRDWAGSLRGLIPLAAQRKKVQDEG